MIPDVCFKEQLNLHDREQLLHLWNREYPATLMYPAMPQLEQYLCQLSDTRHYLVTENNRLLAWAVTFTREAETWFAIILDRSLQGKGIGKQLMQQLQSAHPVLNGWVSDRAGDLKADGTPYRSPLEFYHKCGFSVLADQRLELPQLSAVKITWRAEQEG